MTVLKFSRVAECPPEGWHVPELQQFIAVSARSIAAGEASGWDTGATESGDPQLYLMGPPPDYDCVLSISRMGRVYVIEDGAGHVLYEHENPMLLAEKAAAALRRGKAAIVARVAVAWLALREVLEDEIDVLIEEPMDLLVYLAPKLANLA